MIQLVYITCPSVESAQKIAQYCLEVNLIACANIFPITSMYKDDGKILTGQEVVLIGKTVQQNINLIFETVKKIHPYQIPCIAVFDGQSDQNYQDWIHKQF